LGEVGSFGSWRGCGGRRVEVVNYRSAVGRWERGEEVGKFGRGVGSFMPIGFRQFSADQSHEKKTRTCALDFKIFWSFTWWCGFNIQRLV
jgi:hypothetical protein